MFFNFNINEIDVTELRRLMENETIRLIDVRSPMEVAQGIIPGADHIPLEHLPMQLDQIPQDQKVVLYCRSGARSGQACAFLTSQGLNNTFNLRGGIIAWVQGGQAVA